MIFFGAWVAAGMVGVMALIVCLYGVIWLLKTILYLLANVPGLRWLRWLAKRMPIQSDLDLDSDVVNDPGALDLIREDIEEKSKTWHRTIARDPTRPEPPQRKGGNFLR